MNNREEAERIGCLDNEATRVLEIDMALERAERHGYERWKEDEGLGELDEDAKRLAREAAVASCSAVCIQMLLAQVRKKKK